MCKVTYRDANCVHPLKSAYSSFKMRTEEKIMFSICQAHHAQHLSPHMCFFVCSERELGKEHLIQILEKRSTPLGFNWVHHDCITIFDRITHP